MFNLIPKAVTQKAVEYAVQSFRIMVRRIGSAAMSMAQSSLSSAKVLNVCLLTVSEEVTGMIWEDTAE